MITTHRIKKKRFDGLFQCGNPHSAEVVFMMGSCRGVPHLNFLNEANSLVGQRFKIYYVDPHDFHWDENENLVDIHTAIDRASRDTRIIDAFRSATIFIHEHYANYGCFNTDRSAPGNIYDHGMAAPLDICLPNFHNKYILFQEIFDQGGFDGATEVTYEMFEEFSAVGQASLHAFKEMCAKTSFPEFADYFEANMRRVRMFFSNNHVSHHFTIPLFRLMNEKFLHLPLTETFYQRLYQTPDMYSSQSVVPLTQQDVNAHGWQWDEPIRPLIISESGK
jgi:hypothetical protein